MDEDRILGVFTVVATDTRGTGALVRFEGIDEPVYMIDGSEWPLTENEYVIIAVRDRDGDLVLHDFRDPVPETEEAMTMAQTERSVMRERLSIIVDAYGPAASGKTAALASIVREIQELIGSGNQVTIHGVDSSYELHKRANGEPRQFDRNDVRIEVEVFHHGA